MKTTQLTHKQGVALIIVMSVLALLSVLAITFVFASNLDKTAADGFTSTVLAQLSAESGIEYGLSRLGERPGGPLDEKIAKQLGLTHDTQPLPAFAKTLTLGSKELVVSGVLGDDASSTATYTLHISDESGKLNLNDSNLPLEHGVSADYKDDAAHGRLYLICRILGDLLFESKGEAIASSLFLDEEAGRLSYANDQFPNFAAVTQCLQNAGLSKQEITTFGGYVTLYSWQDPNTLRTSLPVRKGELDDIVDEDFHTWLDFQTWAHDTTDPKKMLDPRCPVNLNTARVELIQALIQPLQGVYLEEGPGETASGVHYGAWAARQNNPTLSHDDRIGTARATYEFTSDQAQRLAQAMYDRAHGVANDDLVAPEIPQTGGGASDPFETWEEFRHFLAHGLNDEAAEAIFVAENFAAPAEATFNGADTEPFWKKYYADIQRDMLFANFNPNTLFNDFNPNSNVNLKVDKAQLAVSTAEFCFEPSGYFMLDSAGSVYNANGEELANYSIHTVVKLFEILRITSQAQFLEGLVDAGQIDNYFNEAWDESANDFATDYEYPPEFSFWKGWFRPHSVDGSRAPANKNWDVVGAKRPALQSYPEPLLPGKESYIANSLFDGQLMLATMEANNYSMTMPSNGSGTPYEGRVYSGSFGQLQAHYNGSPDAANNSEPLNLSRVRRHTNDWNATVLNNEWDRYDVVDPYWWEYQHVMMKEMGLAEDITFRKDNQPYFAPGSPACLKNGSNKPHSGPLTSFDAGATSAFTPGSAYPDGAYSEKDRTLAYQIGHNFDSFYDDAFKGRSGWIQFWIKPRFDVGNSSIIRKFFSGPTRKGGKAQANQSFTSLYYFANHTSPEEDGHGYTASGSAWEKLDHNSMGQPKYWVPRNSIVGGWAWRSTPVSDGGIHGYPGYPPWDVYSRIATTDDAMPFIPYDPNETSTPINNPLHPNFMMAHHTSFSVSRDHALGDYTNQAKNGYNYPGWDSELYNNFASHEWNLLSVSWDFTGKAGNNGGIIFHWNAMPGEMSTPPHCTISINGKNLHAGDQYGWLDYNWMSPYTTCNATTMMQYWYGYWEMVWPWMEPNPEHRLFCGSRYGTPTQFKAVEKQAGAGNGGYGSPIDPDHTQSIIDTMIASGVGSMEYDGVKYEMIDDYTVQVTYPDGSVQIIRLDESRRYSPEAGKMPFQDSRPDIGGGNGGSGATVFDYIDFSSDYFRFGELPRGSAVNTDYSTPYYADSTIDEVVGGNSNLFTEHTAYWNKAMFYGGRYFNMTYNDLGDNATLGAYTSPKINLHQKLGLANEPLTLRSVAWTYYRGQSNRASNTAMPNYPDYSYMYWPFDSFKIWQQDASFPETQANAKEWLNIVPLDDSLQDNLRGVSVNDTDRPDPMAAYWAADAPGIEESKKLSWDAVSVDFRKPESASDNWTEDGWYFEEADSDNDDTYNSYNDRFTYAGGSTFQSQNRTDATYRSDDTFQLRMALHLEKGQQLYTSPVIDDVTVTFKTARPCIKVWETSLN